MTSTPASSGEALHLLERDLAGVGNELEREPSHLHAPVAGAHAVDHELLLPGDEGAADVRDLPGEGREVVAHGVEEGRVTLELRELEAASGIDDRFEQPGDRILRVREAEAVMFHEAGVPANVRDEQQRLLDRHAVESLPQGPWAA